jgi:hypothetical protein
MHVEMGLDDGRKIETQMIHGCLSQGKALFLALAASKFLK